MVAMSRGGREIVEGGSARFVITSHDLNRVSTLVKWASYR